MENRRKNSSQFSILSSPLFKSAVSSIKVFKARQFFDKSQRHAAGRTVALLGDDDFGLIKVFVGRFVIFLAENKRHNICILLNRIMHYIVVRNKIMQFPDC